AQHEGYCCGVIYRSRTDHNRRVHRRASHPTFPSRAARPPILSGRLSLFMALEKRRWAAGSAHSGVSSRATERLELQFCRRSTCARWKTEIGRGQSAWRQAEAEAKHQFRAMNPAVPLARAPGVVELIDAALKARALALSPAQELDENES